MGKGIIRFLLTCFFVFVLFHFFAGCDGSGDIETLGCVVGNTCYEYYNPGDLTCDSIVEISGAPSVLEVDACSHVGYACKNLSFNDIDYSIFYYSIVISGSATPVADMKEDCEDNSGTWVVLL